MKVKQLLMAAGLVCSLMAACTDDERFSTSPSHQLTFSADTVSLDTVFSNVPSAYRSLWVYNRSGEGLRCRSVRLERGGQSGFRVNVDGRYLSEASSFSVSDIEVRHRDSVRILVEVTPPATHAVEPQANTDNLVFTLESGVEQKVNLRAYAWDAVAMRNVRISRDSTIDGQGRPIIIYGGIRVDSAAVLTIAAGTTLYFHQDAGIHVFGRLLTDGSAERPVVLRGDRIDRMFDYLPYDRVPGQWQGLRFYDFSTGNLLRHTDIHSAYDGIVVDSTSAETLKLTLDASTIHNCQGYGLKAENARVELINTQVTNTLRDCVLLHGGVATINNCTLAQFYPFDSNRGVALRFTAKHALQGLTVTNSLVTGYADDMMADERTDTTQVFHYSFADCIIRTPKPTTADSVYFTRVEYENVTDTTVYGVKHFVKIDTDNLRYDFRLAASSPSIDKASVATATRRDHDARPRDERPDIGAYEWFKP